MFAPWAQIMAAVKVEDLRHKLLLLREMVVEEIIIITLSLSNFEEMIEVERIIIISIEVDDHHHHHQLHHHLLKIEKEKEVVMITTTLNDGKSALEVVRTTITTIIEAVEMKGVSPQSILHPPLLRNILELPVSEIVLLETIVEIEVVIIEEIIISHLTLLNLTTTILDVEVDAFRKLKTANSHFILLTLLIVSKHTHKQLPHV